MYHKKRICLELCLCLCFLTTTYGVKDVAAANKTVVFSKKISVDGKKKSLKILSGKDTSQIKISIDGRNVKLKRTSVDAGYLHVKAAAKDIDQDKKEEIILKLAGGSSGSMEEVQVLDQKEENGTWQETQLDPSVWNDNFVQVEKEQNGLHIKVQKTGFQKKLSGAKWKDASAVGVSYRKCAVKKHKLLIKYYVYAGNTGEIAAIVKQSMLYDKDTGKFVCGKTKIAK